VLGEIDQIMEMMESALGSAQRYGASLEALSHDLSGNIDRNRVREIVRSLVIETREAVETNKAMDARPEGDARRDRDAARDPRGRCGANR
jgi:diguanylate cyclase